MVREIDSHGQNLRWKKKTVIFVLTVFLSKCILYPITQISETQRAVSLPQVADVQSVIGSVCYQRAER